MSTRGAGSEIGRIFSSRSCQRRSERMRSVGSAGCAEPASTCQRSAGSSRLNTTSALSSRKKPGRRMPKWSLRSTATSGTEGLISRSQDTPRTRVKRRPRMQRVAEQRAHAVARMPRRIERQIGDDDVVAAGRRIAHAAREICRRAIGIVRSDRPAPMGEWLTQYDGGLRPVHNSVVRSGKASLMKLRSPISRTRASEASI